MIKIRPYQEELIMNTRIALKHSNSVVMQSPTGSGKTLTTSWMVHSALQKNKRCIFCVHRIELVQQTAKAFDKVCIDYGFIVSGEKYDPEKMVHIASINTLTRKLDNIQAPDLLICDEGHRYMAKSHKKVIDYWPEAKKIIITATPERTDRKGLKDIAQGLVIGKTTKWLIENGYLSPFKIFAPGEPDLSNVSTIGGDYQSDELSHAMDTTSITGNALDHYKRHCNGKKAAIFAVGIEHSKNIVKHFNEAGIPCAHLDGMINKNDREDIINKFRLGEILVLSSVNILIEGLDIPDIHACIILRPTKSLIVFLQSIGRCLRPIYAEGYDLDILEGRLEAIKNGPKPYAVILDHAGNTSRFGLPSREREWSLEGSKGKKENKVETSTCPKCFHVWERKIGQTIECPSCGWKQERKEKKEIETIDGELKEITHDDWLKNAPYKKVMGRAKTLEDFIAIGKARGYKPTWARIAFKEVSERRNMYKRK